jgi:hypothetical protein
MESSCTKKLYYWLYDKKLFLLTEVAPQCNKHHRPLLLRYYIHPCSFSFCDSPPFGLNKSITLHVMRTSLILWGSGFMHVITYYCDFPVIFLAEIYMSFILCVMSLKLISCLSLLGFGYFKNVIILFSWISFYHLDRPLYLWPCLLY